MSQLSQGALLPRAPPKQLKTGGEAGRQLGVDTLLRCRYVATLAGGPIAPRPSEAAQDRG